MSNPDMMDALQALAVDKGITVDTLFAALADASRPPLHAPRLSGLRRWFSGWRGPAIGFAAGLACALPVALLLPDGRVVVAGGDVLLDDAAQRLDAAPVALNAR